MSPFREKFNMLHCWGQGIGTENGQHRSMLKLTITYYRTYYNVAYEVISWPKPNKISGTVKLC